jgi:hypothetical protein
MPNSPLDALGPDRSNQQLELLIAIHKFRQEIEALVPRSSKTIGHWDLDTIQKISKIFIQLLDAVATETKEDVENDIQIVIKHPASSVLSDFVLALDDLKKGVLNPRLQGQINTTGNSLNSIEQKYIGFGLMLVEMLHQNNQNKKTTLKNAREEAATILKGYGVKIREQEITASKLKEWHRDYNLDGSKK